MSQNQEFFMYRGYPLVRKGCQIYYGYMSEPFVVMLEIKHQVKLEDGMEIADKVNVYQMKTHETNPVKAVIKKSERSNLYEAVDLAHIWLKRTEMGDEKKSDKKVS
ncbi:MAG: hypothetical protein LIO74_03020 [Ruminococcus sp.]|nr:hypothetical protein [Ruminococcus sp.]